MPADFPGPVHYGRLRECVERYVRLVGNAEGIGHLAAATADDGRIETGIGRAEAPGRCAFETDDE